MDGSYPKGVTTQIVLKITGIAMRGCNCKWKVSIYEVKVQDFNSSC